MRILQTFFDVLILLCVLLLIISGAMMSRYVFAFLGFSGGASVARIMHLIGSFWGFVLMCVHVGFHGTMLQGVARKMFSIQSPSRTRQILLRIVAIGISIYGMLTFSKRQLGSHLLLQNQYVFFDFSEPLFFFFLDYIAIMGLLICVGYYISKNIRNYCSKN